MKNISSIKFDLNIFRILERLQVLNIFFGGGRNTECLVMNKNREVYLVPGNTSLLCTTID